MFFWLFLLLFFSFLSSFLSSSCYLYKSSNFLFSFVFHLLTIYLSLIIILLLLLLLLLLLSLLLSLLLCWLILPLQVFTRNQVGESSKQGIQAAWSAPINHLKWWISHSRGIYRTLTTSEGRSFWYYLDFHQLCNVTSSSVLVVVGILYLHLHFIIIVIIITFIADIFFIIFIITRIFIKSSLLFL